MTTTITSITVPTTTIITTTTFSWCAKTYRQCQGTAWPGSGNCSSCGAYIGTGGVCLALVELTVQQKKHAECPCCECV